MTGTQLIQNINTIFFSILRIGIKEDGATHKVQRIIYFNAVLFSLPIVYFIFVAMDASSYWKPLSEWYFDQFSFFIFVLVCLFCYVLNHFKLSELSKLIFILSWPFVLHIIPIIIQATPQDYYYAFPLGIIFHSMLVQILFSKKESPWLFWSLLIANFALAANYLTFLLHFDLDERTKFQWLAENNYNQMVVILYWLLFNLIINYLLTIIDSELLKMLKSKNIIEEQKYELEAALDNLQKSNTQILRTEKMTSLGILTSGVAHEINNPLNYISGGRFGIEEFLDENHIEKNENVEFYLESIQKGVERISNIVLNLHKFSGNGFKTNMEYDVHEILDNCIRILNSKTEGRIDIHRNYTTKSLILIGNVAEMHQVFINVLSNSVQSIKEDGKISVDTVKQEQRVLISIKDTGSGIAKENIPKITDPFFTTKDPGQGTGLGLSIAYKIVNEHNGEMEFQSEEGTGTEVIIKLPFNYTSHKE